MSDSDDELPDAARIGRPDFEPEQAELFARALRTLNAAGVPYLLAGAFAKHAYTGIWRDTKDLDIFLKPGDLQGALDALTRIGMETEIVYNHWLAKAWQEPYFIDLIFGTGHGQLAIDNQWFENSRPTQVAGVPVQLIPLEELIVSKAFIGERYRFDGADVLHLILRAPGRIDWQRVLALLGKNWPLLLWHLVLFAYVYPGKIDLLPRSLMSHLFEELLRQSDAPGVSLETFRGALIDPFSFAVDMEDWGSEDRRDLRPVVDDQGAVAGETGV